MGTAPAGMLSRLNMGKGLDTTPGVEWVLRRWWPSWSPSPHMGRGTQDMAPHRLMEERRGCADHYHGGGQKGGWCEGFRARPWLHHFLDVQH